jgi:transcriptional regulator with XRE-family HTH domain
MCPAHHKHAETGTCYVIHKCRCDECRAAKTARESRRNRLKAYGRYDSGLVDAAPVREHVERLRAAGMGYKTIGARAGVGTTAVRSLVYGREDYVPGGGHGPRHGEVKKRMARSVAEKILAVEVTLETLPAVAHVDGTGTRRRLQALVCLGWSMSKLAGRLGMEASNFSRVMHGERLVRVETAKAAAALFDELWSTPAPASEHREKIAASRARRYARERRWLPPLAWDDPDTDREPPVADVVDVDEVAVQLAMNCDSVRLNGAERREAVRRLNGQHLSDSLIASRLGLTPRTVLRIRQELGLAAAVDAAGEVIAA